jgi:hypothetical protein
VPQEKRSRAIPLDERLELEAQFLKACFRLIPEMKTSLRDDVLPLRPRSRSKPNKKFLSAVEAWAARFNVNVPWVRDAIHNSLLNWKNPQTDDVPIMACGAERSPFSWEECQFTFAHPGWNPAWDNEEEARAILVTAFNDQISEHFAWLRGKAAKLDIRPLPKRRKRVSAPNKRVDWLVLRVVRRWTVRKILDEANKRSPKKNPPDEQHAAAATRELAETLGLDSPSRRGRRVGISPAK